MVINREVLLLLELQGQSLQQVKPHPLQHSSTPFGTHLGPLEPARRLLLLQEGFSSSRV